MNLMDLIAAAAQGRPGQGNPVDPSQTPAVQTPAVPVATTPPPNVVTAPPPNPTDDSTVPDILVQGAPKRTIDEDDRSPAGPRDTDPIQQHHGLFGIHGTLRDVLGTLGDALLIGSNHQAIYRPEIQKEQTEDALYDFTKDPRAAANRLALVDPTMALQVNKEADAADADEAKQAAQKLAAQIKAHTVLGSIAGGLVGHPDLQKKYRPMLQKLSDANDLGYTFGDDTTDDDYAAISKAGMTPDQQADNTRADDNQQSQDDYRKGQLTVAQARVQQAREAAAARVRVAQQNAGVAAGSAAERVRHDKAMEGIGITNATRPRGKPSLLDSLRSAHPNIPPPPGGGTLRKIN